MNKIEKTNIILQSIMAKIISFDWEQLKENEIHHLLKFVDYEKIPERVLTDISQTFNEEIYSKIIWENMDRMKIVRLVARNEKISKYVDLSKYNYTIKEIKQTLKIRPNLIDKFKIDFENLNLDDAFSFLTIGIEDLLEKIDVTKYFFSPKETYEIIESNGFSEKTITTLNTKDLMDYHICDIIINTGDLYFYILDLKKLTARKWLKILIERPNLLYYCDLEKFKKSDIYNSVELVCLFPNEDLDYLIKERDFRSELSALGWEKLIINKPSEYVDLCCYWKFNETNWKNIIRYHPNLAIYKL